MWIGYFHGGGMVFWQVSLSIMFLVPLCLGYYKFFNLIHMWRGNLLWAFFNTQAFILYTVMIACSFCFCYVAVDPLHTRGIYNNLADTVLTTLGLPPTLTGTFIITMIWISGFSNSTVFTRKELVERLSKIFLAIMTIFFLVDLISSFIKGVYINETNENLIIGVYYIIAAAGIVLFYIIVAVRIKRKIKDIQEEFSSGSSTLPILRRMVNRNMWIFALLYGAWIIVAGVTISSISWKPVGRLTTFWFVYALIACINFCHALMVSATSTKFGVSGSDTGNSKSTEFKSGTEASKTSNSTREV